jgi:acetyl-CoA C-acetyltransferase
MTDVFIYDHVRTPRGRGKKDGSLHEVPSVRLAAKVLEAIRDRNGLDTEKVDDIIMGCVDPVMDAGAVIPKAAAFEAGYFLRRRRACRSRASAPQASMP